MLKKELIAVQKIRYITKKGKKSNVYAYVEYGKIKNVSVDGNFNGLRHQNQCDALRKSWENKNFDRFIFEELDNNI